MRSRFGLKPRSLLQTQHEIEKYGGHRLVVGRAAAIKVAAFFDQLERIALPVGAFRIHDVDVCEQQHAFLLCARRANARDDIAVVRFAFGNHDLQVVGRESRCPQPRLRGADDLRAGPGRGRRVDFDHLLVDLAKRRLCSTSAFCACAEAANRNIATKVTLMDMGIDLASSGQEREASHNSAA